MLNQRDFRSLSGKGVQLVHRCPKALLQFIPYRVKMINFMDPAFRKPRTRCRGTGSDPETCTCCDGVLFLTSVGNGLLGATFHIFETGKADVTLWRALSEVDFKLVEHRCTCNETWGPNESASLLQAFVTSSKCMDLSNFQFCNVAELGMVITTRPSKACGTVVERPVMDTNGAAATILEQMEDATEVSILCLMSIKDVSSVKCVLFPLMPGTDIGTFNSSKAASRLFKRLGRNQNSNVFPYGYVERASTPTT